jgi:hypothetical protein
MLRLKAAALALAMVAACGTPSPPTELHTAAEPPAVVQVDERRPWPDIFTPPTTSTTSTTVPPTTTTTAPARPSPRPPVVSAAAATSPEKYAPGPCGGWDATIAAHFPAEQIAKACSVMMCESRGNPTAENPRSSASGLWQFLSSTWESTTGTPAPASSYSADVQTAAAATLWRSSGWRPWSCA